MRYNNKYMMRNAEGKRVHRSTPIPSIPTDSSDVYVQVSIYDRLDILAQRFYNNRDFWWVIAAANDLGKGTLFFKEGQIIRIPQNPMEIQNRINDKGY